MILCRKRILATQCCMPLIFQTTISVQSNNLSLKYKTLTLLVLGSKDTRKRQFEFVATTQFI